MMPMSLQVENLALGYAGQPVLEDVSLALASGEIGCLLGASGSGKSTLLRAVAGFEPVQRGSIRLQGRQVSAPGQMAPAHLRGVGMVFQDHALFPHLRVAENVGFGLRELPRRERAERVGALLEMVGLQALARAWPHELSGGQQQRVALARALARRPALLLLDEPFANLDANLRERLGAEVRALLKEHGTAGLLVTHDQREAFAMADVVGVLEGGRLQQWAPPFELYHRPASRAVASFIGEGELMHGIVGPGGIALPAGVVPLPAGQRLEQGSRVEVLLRPDDIVPDPASAHTATVTARSFRGAEFLYTLGFDCGARALALMPSRFDFPVGACIGVRLELAHVIAFPSQ